MTGTVEWTMEWTTEFPYQYLALLYRAIIFTKLFLASSVLFRPSWLQGSKVVCIFKMVQAMHSIIASNLYFNKDSSEVRRSWKGTKKSRTQAFAVFHSLFHHSSPFSSPAKRHHNFTKSKKFKLNKCFTTIQLAIFACETALMSLYCILLLPSLIYNL